MSEQLTSSKYIQKLLKAKNITKCYRRCGTSMILAPVWLVLYLPKQNQASKHLLNKIEIHGSRCNRTICSFPYDSAQALLK